MHIILLLLFIVVCTANLWVLRGSGWICAHSLFVCFNGLMGVGILYNLDYANSVDLAHAAIVLITAVMYLLGSAYFADALRLRRTWTLFTSRALIVADARDLRFSLLLYIVSLAISIFYFYLVGYNVLFRVILSGSGNVDASSLRLASYAGEKYFAPGYFNQFKNVLLPWAFITVAAILAFMSRRSQKRTFAAIMLGIPVVLCLLGTGQRAFLFFFLATLFIAVVLFTRGRVSVGMRVRVFAYATAAIFLFSFLNVALGRSNDSGFSTAISSFFSRIGYDQQIGDVVGFRYVYGLPVEMGMEWASSLLGVLPSQQASGLAGRVHALMYGSERGTAPVSMWTSVFYNWGWPGVFLFPLILAGLYAVISRAMLQKTVIRAPELVTVAFVNFYLASWISSGPMQLVNNGLVTVFLILLFLRLWRAIRALQSRSWKTIPSLMPAEGQAIRR